MSVVNEINRIKTNIANAYTSLGQKGATLPATLNSANLASTVSTVPTGGGTIEAPKKDVNFYDYDGTIVASYTASEFANLSELPSNPSHSGLTAQGWNWTLADAKSYVAEYGKLNIGQLYITDNNKTRIYITLEEGRLEPTLGFATNGTVTIDWGDGSNTQDVTGTSSNTILYTQHTYSNPGNYVISLDLATGTNKKIYIKGISNRSSLLTKNSNTLLENYIYMHCIKKVELGKNIAISTYGFYNCAALESITMPEGTSQSNTNQFERCYSLKNIVFPKSFTEIPTGGLADCHALKNILIPKEMTYIQTRSIQNCYVLQDITLPNNITLLSTYAFYNCVALTKIIIPKSITSISGNLFNGCAGVKYFDFSKHTTIPTMTASVAGTAFGSLASDYQIIVPNALYDDWKATTGWSTIASHIVKASEV